MTRQVRYNGAYKRLEVLILPRRAETEAELAALSAAANAQADYEELCASGLSGISESNDGVSRSATRSRLPGGFCYEALAYLRAAGLMKSGIVAAKPFY